MTTAIQVAADPSVQQYTVDSLVEANEWLDLARQTPITSDELQQGAADLLKQVKEKYRRLEDRRTAVTKPINEGLRALNDWFRPPKQALEDLERILKTKIAEYVASKEAANTAAIVQAAAAPTAEQATQILSTLSPVAAPTGVSIRYVWVAQIVDPDAVPREFCSPDPTKIKAYVATTTGEPSVPGIRFTKEPAVAVRQG